MPASRPGPALLPLVLLTALVASRQAPGQSAADLQARVQAAAADTALDGPGAHPFHLRLAVTLSPDHDPEAGTLEEWWSGPDQYRITYSMPSYHATLVHQGADVFQTPGAGTPPYLLTYVLDQEVHPLQAGPESLPNQPVLRRQSFGKATLDCIMLSQPIKGFDGVLPLGLFPTYCMEPGKTTLRITVDDSSQIALRERVGLLRGIDVPLDLTLTIEDRLALRAHTEQLQSQAGPYTAELTTDGLEQRRTETARLSSGLAAGMLLTKVSPSYPVASKRRHAEGTVVLHAKIGTDGHIESLRPVTFPDPDLVIAAIRAVRQWVYRPYLLNGVPTEVDTIITVHFTLA